MFCENCGAQIAANAKFCRGCGKTVEAQAAPQQPAAQPQYQQQQYLQPAQPQYQQPQYRQPAQPQQPMTLTVCRNCGAALAANAKFCDACGTQTAAEQTAIQEQQIRNAGANTDKSVSGSVWITVAMVIFALFFIILFGFEEGEARVVTITAIAFAVFMTGLKWHFEIKAQKRWKREAEENARRGDRRVL